MDRGWQSQMAWLRAHWLPLLFLLCALPTGLGMVLLTPIGDVSDEPQHISRADGLLSGQIIGTNWRGSATAGVMMNAALFVVTITENQSLNFPLPKSLRQRARAVRWNDHRFGVSMVYSTTQMVRCFPVFYIPGALGILVGQVLRITPLDSLFLGRGFMLFSFLSMGAAALHFARFGRALLFTVLTLPMTLYLASSFNQDGPIIAAAALAASLLTRDMPRPRWRQLLALLLMTLIACSKPPYGWLILACLPPLIAFGLRQRLALVATAAAPPILWLWESRRASDWPWDRAAYYPGPLWPGSRAVPLTAISVRGNIEVLLAHPAQIILLPVKAWIMQAPTLGRQMIGLLDWEWVSLATWQYAGWLLALAASLLAVVFKSPDDARERSFYLALLLATMLSIGLSAYVTYTNLGYTSIDGLRGRYLLPVLPFLLFVSPLAGRWRHLPVIRWITPVPMAAYFAPALTMAALDVYALPAQLWRMFRMAGP